MQDLKEVNPVPVFYDPAVILQPINETKFSKAIGADLFDGTCLKNKDIKAKCF